MKKITLVILSIVFLLIVTKVNAISYDIDVSPDLETNRLDMNILVKNFDSSLPYLLKISHPHIFIPPNKDVLGLGTIHTPSIEIIPVEIQNDKFMFFNQESTIKLKNLTLETKRVFRKNGVETWNNFIIEIPPMLKDMDIFEIRISNMNLPAQFQYLPSMFPEDKGEANIYLDFPVKSEVNLFIETEESFEIDNESVRISSINLNRDWTSIQNLNFKEGTTKLNPYTGEFYSPKYQKLIYFETENDTTTIILFEIIRPKIYSDFLKVFLLIMIFLLVVAALLREFRIYIAAFVFLFSVYSIYGSIKPQNIQTLLDIKILSIIQEWWFILLIVVTPLLYSLLGTHKLESKMLKEYSKYINLSVVLLIIISIILFVFYIFKQI